MPIVRNVDWLAHQPILKIAPSLVDRVCGPAGNPLRKPTIILLEAYLQVVDAQPLREALLSEDDAWALFVAMAGALHSPKFIDTKSAYLRCRDLLAVLDQMSEKGPRFKRGALAPFLRVHATSWAERFEEKPLNDEKMWLKHGWGVETIEGRAISFPLYPFYERLGRAHTQVLSDILAAIYRHKRNAWPKWLPALSDFVANYSGEFALDAALLRDGVRLRIFLNEFGRAFVKGVAKRGRSIESACRVWNSSFMPAVNHLINGDFLAELQPPLCRLRGHRVAVPGSETNIKTTKDGVQVKVNLLTAIPLEVTDGDAMELLFAGITDDLGAVLTWASLEVEDIWGRRCCAVAAAEVGRVWDYGRIGYKHDFDINSEVLANCAATLKANGLPVGGYQVRKVYAGLPLKKLAFALGLPINGSLLPHAALIVANHAEITTSFLDSLELFDKRGVMSGLVTLDGASYLIGKKLRRGHVWAQQKIRLTSYTRSLVDQVIALTAPLRAYLKGSSDDSWRYLFLTVASLTAKPKKQKFSDQSSFEHKYGLGGLVACFRARVPMAEALSRELVARLSLKSIRGSSALIVYLRKGSSSEMAEALGHATYQPKLLDHYLPEAIQKFFRDRWVRIFQEGIVCEAMKDSELLLEAASFSSMEALNSFLSQHAMKLPLGADDVSGVRQSITHGQVLFNTSPRVLAPLLALQDAVDSGVHSLSGKARYWCSVCRHLVNYLEEQMDRPDLRRCLDDARRLASTCLSDGFEV